MIKRFLIVLVALIVIFYSCNNKKQTIVFIDTIHYENGNIYSKGEYLVSINGDDTIYKKQKAWSYNYPNGKIWQILIYNENNTPIENNTYSLSGLLKYQYKAKDDDEEWKYFDDSGRLNSIETVKLYTTSSSSDETKTFYGNGMLLEENTTIDDNDVSDEIYDTTGRKVLSLINKNGRWIKKY